MERDRRGSKATQSSRGSSRPWLRASEDSMGQQRAEREREKEGGWLTMKGGIVQEAIWSSLGVTVESDCGHRSILRDINNVDRLEDTVMDLRAASVHQ